MSLHSTPLSQFHLSHTQTLLVGTSAFFLLGAVFQTSKFALLMSVLVQLCVGGYWPCVGYFRGRLLLHEQRNMVIVITKYVGRLFAVCCVCCSWIAILAQILCGCFLRRH